MKKSLTKHQASAKHKVSVRTIERAIQESFLNPVGFSGKRALYDEAEIAKAVQKREAHRIESLKRSSTGGIITLKEAKRLAGRRK
jgi:hypothetical protein